MSFGAVDSTGAFRPSVYTMSVVTSCTGWAKNGLGSK